jgi:hypothetical protein
LVLQKTHQNQSQDPEASFENFMTFWAGAVISALFVNTIYTPEMSAQNGKVVGPEKVRKLVVSPKILKNISILRKNILMHASPRFISIPQPRIRYLP